MKKRIPFFLTLALIFCFCIPVFAQSEPTEETRIFVYDQDGVLTDAQEQTLNDKLTAFREKNQFDLVIVFANGVLDRKSYADGFYDQNDFGYGKSKDGALLLVNVGPDHTYTKSNSWISTCGSGMELIPDEDISDIGAELTPLLLEKKFYEAADRFADLADAKIHEAKVGRILRTVLITAAVCTICAFIYCGKLKRQLKSVHFAADANNYVVENSLGITRAYDHFLYAHVSRVAKESNSSHSSGSSGSSHGGGGF